MNKLVKRLGYIGSWLTAVCAIHCVLIPMLIALLPFLGIGFIITARSETFLITIGVFFSIISLCWGYRYHGNLRAFAFLFGAIMWLILAQQQTRSHVWHSTIGASCLVAANFVNRRLCKTCIKCHNHCER